MVLQIEVKPVIETKGSGTVYFNDETQTSTDFQFRLLPNGTLEVEINFPTTFTKYFEISFNKSVVQFELRGKASIWSRTEQIVLSDCYLTSFEFLPWQSINAYML